MKVEDLWDVVETQITATDKLNACFQEVLVSSFPTAPSSQAVEIRSDASLAEAVQLLSHHKLLSAPVVDVDAPADASWMDRYIGVVKFAGIVVWILYQSEPPSPRSDFRVKTSTISGLFFENLTSSDMYKNTKYKMKSIPVVDLGEGRIDVIITQSAVIHMLTECAGLEWFAKWGTKRLSELGRPIMNCDQMCKVYENEPVMRAFKLMWKRSVGKIHKRYSN